MPYKNPEDKRRQGTKWMREWRLAHPEEARRKTREHLRRWRPKNRKRISKYNKKSEKYRKKWRVDNHERILGWYRRQRAESLKYLGGRCKCCGESEYEFLTIDHVNNDGYKERKRVNGYNAGGYHIHKWIVTAFRSKDSRQIRKIRKRYQVLCHNCNSSKSFYGGSTKKCIHKRRTHPTRR